MIDPKDFSKREPVLKLEHLGGAKEGILHISHVEKATIGGDDKLRLRFAEFPLDPNKEKPSAFYPSFQQIQRLVDGLGNDEKTWIGKPVVVESTRQPDPSKGGLMTEVMWIADPKTWPGHFEAARVQAEGDAGTSGKKTTSKKR